MDVNRISSSPSPVLPSNPAVVRAYRGGEQGDAAVEARPVGNPLPARSASSAERVSATHAVLDPAEKDYFASAFPGASDALQPHLVYTSRGKSTAQPTGLIVDRKG